MAYVADTRRTAAALPLSWISELVEAFKLRIAYRAAYMSTFNELNAMTDRELADIGISRLVIRETAREAAEMAIAK